MLRQTVAHWAKDVIGKKWVMEQNIDPLQSYRLKSLLSSVLIPNFPSTILLPRPSSCKETPATTPIPVGAHFVYHNPIESKLSLDGYSGYQAPQSNGKELFARRMWAGGNIRFHKNLPVSSIVKCTEEVTAVRQMQGLCFVSIQRTFTDPAETEEYISEKRTLVYTNENYKFEPESLETTSENSINSANGPCFKIDSSQNFRFSALTYNAHKIHYDLQYCKSEGLPGPIVSGPFIITIILNLFSHLHPKVRICAVEYRNRLVILENTQIAFSCTLKREKVYTVNVRSSNDVLVNAEITVC